MLVSQKQFQCLYKGDMYIVSRWGWRVITVGIGWVLLASATSGVSGKSLLKNMLVRVYTCIYLTGKK